MIQETHSLYHGFILTFFCCSIIISESIIIYNMPKMLFPFPKSQFRYISYNSVRTWYSNLVKPKKNESPFKHIIQIGDPTLRVQSEKVPEDMIKSKEIQFLIKRLKYVFKKYNCVGLSASQIGIPLQICVLEFNKNHAGEYGKNEFQIKEMSIQPQMVIINPQIKIIDYAKLVFPEACESVRGYFADVPRYRALHLKAHNEDGEVVSLDAEGWFARIVQHEMDHLNGKIYTDIMNPKTLTCSCWNTVNERGGKVILPFGAD